ncbi:hypothetical protein [Streptomyces sp. SAS_276]|uniref:hypothetical protein n=1 Tax=Streptomyces sp. SAS_276 TaxID=3412745 RepID=UPI00403C2AF3
MPDGVTAVPATARLLDHEETARVEEMTRRRFSMYRVVHLVDRALRRERPLAAIAVRAQPPLGRGVSRDFPDTRS